MGNAPLALWGYSSGAFPMCRHASASRSVRTLSPAPAPGGRRLRWPARRFRWPPPLSGPASGGCPRSRAHRPPPRAGPAMTTRPTTPPASPDHPAAAPRRPPLTTPPTTPTPAPPHHPATPPADHDDPAAPSPASHLRGSDLPRQRFPPTLRRSANSRSRPNRRGAAPHTRFAEGGVRES